MLPIVELETEPADGLRNSYMTQADTEAVLALLRQVRPRRVVEFGINYGFTAREILQRVSGIEEYVGIEVTPGYKLAPRFQWPEIPLFPGREVKGDDRVRLMVLERGSFDLDPEDIGPVDAAIIDGDHSEDAVLRDTWLAVENVRSGGVIIWHDYSDITNTDVPAALHSLIDRRIFWAAGTAVAFERVA